MFSSSLKMQQVSRLYSFVLSNNIPPVRVYQILCICILVHGNLHLLTFWLSRCCGYLCACPWVDLPSISFKYIPVSGNFRSHGHYKLSIFEQLLRCFLKWLQHFTGLPQCPRVIKMRKSFSTPHQYWLASVLHSALCAALPHCSFNLHFHMLGAYWLLLDLWLIFNKWIIYLLTVEV